MTASTARPSTCGKSKHKFWQKGKNGCDGEWKTCSKKEPRLFPPEARGSLQDVQRRELTLKTLTGEIVLPADYGRDRASGQRVMPLREKLGLQEHSSLTPVLEDRLCCLALTAPSYEKAAEVARQFGISTDDSQIQRLVQRRGERAQAQAEERVARAFDLQGNREVVREAARELKGEPPFSMVLMLDGTMLRSRGKDWGLKPASVPGERVAWHELKAGLVIRLPESSPDGPRRELAKYYVASDGDPESVGRRLYAEALRRGLEQARRVYVIADGAAWIWNVAAEHFPGSGEVLDFYHASEHLWALARALWGEEGDAARSWVTPLLHTLKHRGGESLLPVLEELLRAAAGKGDAEPCKTLKREAAYFRRHESRLGNL